MASSNFRTLIFGIKFAVIFAVLMGGFEASRGTAVERFLVEDFILQPTAALIRVIDANDNVQVVGRTLKSNGSRLRVVRGCEGVEIFLLLAAAILAYPASWAARARGLGSGFLLAYALSVGRLIALHFTLRYAPNAWEYLHGFVLPLGPIFLTMVYFMAWTGRQGPQDTQGPQPNVA
jgi:exosortase/archaeosortase family protein